MNTSITHRQSPEIVNKSESVQTQRFKRVPLRKVAKQLNVTIDRLVDHLEEKGYAGALSGKGINVGIRDEEAYRELLEFFSDDRETVERVKEKRASRQAELAEAFGDTPKGDQEVDEALAEEEKRAVHAAESAAAVREIEDGKTDPIDADENGESSQNHELQANGSTNERTPTAGGTTGARERRPDREASRETETERRGASPAEELLIIDGSNVSWWRKDKPSLAILLTVLLELIKRRFSFLLYLDANYERKLREEDEEEARVLKRLLKRLRDSITVVPGGKPADLFVLQYADAYGNRIIANDRYQEYREKYPWIEREEDRRLLKGAVARNTIQIPDLDLIVPVAADSKSLVDEILRLFPL